MKSFVKYLSAIFEVELVIQQKMDTFPLNSNACLCSVLCSGIIEIKILECLFLWQNWFVYMKYSFTFANYDIFNVILF